MSAQPQDRILREQYLTKAERKCRVGDATCGRRQGRYSYQPRATPWVHQPKTPSALKARFILRPTSRQPEALRCARPALFIYFSLCLRGLAAYPDLRKFSDYEQDNSIEHTRRMVEVGD